MAKTDLISKFPSQLQQMKLDLYLLLIGSGFRYLLQDARNGQGACWLTIRMGQTNSTCDAIRLVSFSVDDIQKLFDLKATSFILWQNSAYEIGSQLLALGYHNPGEFVMKHMTHSAVNAVSTIVETFPLTFKDEYMCMIRKCVSTKKPSSWR